MKSPVLKQVMQALSYDKFKKIVGDHWGDRYSKSFNSWSHLHVMIIFQITGRTSIRDLVNYIKVHSSLLYHCGIISISKSNLSHNNATRPYEIFERFYYSTLEDFRNKLPNHKKKKFKLKKKIKSIDSSTISLCKPLYEWATFRKNKGGIKLHTSLDNDSGIPDFISIGEAKTNDAKGVWAIPILPGCIYAVDRAYLCLKWLNKVILANSHFVIRLKKNTKYEIVKPRKVSSENKKKGVISDQEIKFIGTKKEDYTGKLRMVEFIDIETGKKFKFITDNFKLSPYTIAEIYKNRWQIELFFKKIKQNLKIKSFIGRTENSVKIQIWIAMIVLLLHEFSNWLSMTQLSLKEFLSKVCGNLFSLRRLEEILNSSLRNKCKTKMNCTQQVFSF
jgi:hypothetical protein